MSNFEIQSSRKRVNKLGKDGVEELAYKEKELREGKISPDEFSDILLEKKEFEEAALIDHLTGLGNRKALEEIIPKKLSAKIREEREIIKKNIPEDRREKKELAVLMIDFDHFKEVNDKFGHQAGDQALQKLSGVIKGMTRQSDYVFRYGGEEFVVLLAPANCMQAKFLADRIRKKVGETDIVITDKNGKEQHLRRTISVGCHSTEQMPDIRDVSGEDLVRITKKMIENADFAAFQSKEAGRNRTTMFSENIKGKGRLK